MKHEKKEISFVKYKAEDLSIDFPNNEYLSNEEKAVTRNAINQGSIVKMMVGFLSIKVICLNYCVQVRFIET